MKRVVCFWDLSSRSLKACLLYTSTPSGISYYDQQGEVITPEITHVDWDIDVAEKGGYPDFMLKEIHEQPRVVRDTLAGRMSGREIKIDELTLTRQELTYIDRVLSLIHISMCIRDRYIYRSRFA